MSSKKRRCILLLANRVVNVLLKKAAVDLTLILSVIIFLIKWITDSWKHGENFRTKSLINFNSSTFISNF